MQINISTRHGHLSGETQAKVVEKLEKLPRLYDRVTAIEAIVDLEHRESPGVELKISAKGKDFVATSQTVDLLASVDDVIEKMEQQLRKHKDKVQDRHRGPAPRQ